MYSLVPGRENLRGDAWLGLESLAVKQQAGKGPGGKEAQRDCG